MISLAVMELYLQTDNPMQSTVVGSKANIFSNMNICVCFKQNKWDHAEGQCVYIKWDSIW